MEVEKLESAAVDLFFSSRRRHTRFDCDWSSDVCSSDLSGTEVADQLQAVSRDLEPVAAECCEQFGVELRRQVRIVGDGQVEDPAGFLAADVDRKSGV